MSRGKINIKALTLECITGNPGASIPFVARELHWGFLEMGVSLTEYEIQPAIKQAVRALRREGRIEEGERVVGKTVGNYTAKAWYPRREK